MTKYKCSRCQRTASTRASLSCERCRPSDSGNVLTQSADNPFISSYTDYSSGSSSSGGFSGGGGSFDGGGSSSDYGSSSSDSGSSSSDSGSSGGGSE